MLGKGEGGLRRKIRLDASFLTPLYLLYALRICVVLRKTGGYVMRRRFGSEEQRSKRHRKN